MTSGVGSIGDTSMETLAKDFRAEISKNPNRWSIDKNAYTIEEITKKFQEFIFNEKYSPFFNQWAEKPELYFIVAGYSKSGSKVSNPELWQISIIKGICKDPIPMCKPSDTGIYPLGMYEPIYRIYCGFSTLLEDQVLRKVGLDDTKIKEIKDSCFKNLIVPFVYPAMPIQDAIDLAKFLVDMTEKYYRYTPFTSSYVSGPIEIAAITQHEGFNWVQRKLYFSGDLNPTSVRSE